MVHFQSVFTYFVVNVNSNLNSPTVLERAGSRPLFIPRAGSMLQVAVALLVHVKEKP